MPIGRKRAFSIRPVRIAVSAPPPEASTAVAPNCEAPANTKADMAIAAVAPITGRATTPNEMPARNAAIANGTPVLIPAEYEPTGVVTLAASHAAPFERPAVGNHRPRGRRKSIRADDDTRGCRADAPRMALDIDALETSFDAVAPRGDELVEDFYARLFEAAPGVRGLFSDDMRRQKAMLLSALVLVRKSLRDLDGLLPTLRALGARHVAYGAKAEHYPVVGTTLIASMAAIAGDDWKPEYDTAWTEAFLVIAGVMIEAAEEEEERQYALAA